MRILMMGAAVLALGACNRGAATNNNSAPAANAATAANATTPVALSKGATQQAGMPLGRPLGPLLEEDRHSSGKTGCNAMFTGREGMYLSVIDGEMMVRTPADRQLCSITDAQLQSLGEPGGEVSCGGVRISVRETGERDLSPETDSSSAPAILSATQDGVTGTLDGTWGTAC